MNATRPELGSARVHRGGRLRLIALALVAASCVAIVGFVVVLLVVRGDQLPEVTFAILDGAVASWERAGPSDYDLRVKLSGVMQGEAKIEVREGHVTAMTLNGRPTKPHTWDEWSVPAMFAIIRRDLEACAAANLDPTIVFARGEFDPVLGNPTRYRRVTPTGMDAEWQIELIPKK